MYVNDELKDYVALMRGLGARISSLWAMDCGTDVTDAQAWEGKWGEKIRRYLTVHGLLAGFGAARDEAVRDQCDQMVEVDPVSYLDAHCAGLIVGSYEAAWTYLLSDPTPTIRAKYYALAKMLHVIALQQWLERNDPWTTADLTRPAAEQFRKLIETAENGQCAEVSEQYGKMIGWDMAQMYGLWLRLYGRPVEMPQIKKGRKTSKAGKLMDQAGMSEHRKAQIYCCARLYGLLLVDHNGSIKSPYRYLRRILEPSSTDLSAQDALKALYVSNGKFSLAGGFLGSEKEFNDLVGELRGVLPTQYYLDLGEYSSRRTEIAYEAQVLRASGAALNEGTLIYEPNPHMVMSLLGDPESVTDAQMDTCPTAPVLAWGDINQAYAYQTQYPQATIAYYNQADGKLYRLSLDQKSKGYFCRAEEENGTWQTIVAYWRTNNAVATETLQNLGHYLREEGNLYSHLPNVLINAEAVRETLCTSFRIESMLIYPTSGDPKNKQGLKNRTTVQMQRGTTDSGTVPVTKLAHINAGEGWNYLVAYNHVVHVTAEALREGRKTLNALWEYAYRRGTTVQTRQARCYRYTQEICMWYSWSRGDGEYYYCRCPVGRQQTYHLARGKRISSRIKFYARDEATAEKIVAAALDKPEMQRLIAQDVIKAYKGKGMSYRSYHYCYSTDMRGTPRYKPKMAKWLFSQDVFAEMHTAQTYTLDQYREIMEPIVAEKPDQGERLQLWEQLDILLAHAVRQKWIDSNPVHVYVAAMQDKQDRYEEVRKALAKKSMTMEEEIKMLEAVRDRLPQDGLMVGAVIQMYTGMQIHEIRALTWGDFVKLQFAEGAMLRVSKQLDAAARVVPLDGTKLRWVPCAPVLYKLLRARRDFVKNRIDRRRKLDNMPIVAGKDDDLAKPATRDQLYHATRQLIAGAGIEEHEIYLPSAEENVRETDMNDYHGVLLRSNFQFHARQTCKMTSGEIAYILGNAPTDTLSAHYCDYGNAASQIMMAGKLSRWDCRHGGKGPNTMPKTTAVSLEKGETWILQAAQYAGPMNTVLDLQIVDADSGAMIAVTVTDQTGMDLEIIKK